MAIFDVIAGYDPAYPVTATGQGKRADSYLRFPDKDGARLGVVRQLFTSENADPGATARIGPQRERFPLPRASGCCRPGQRTFAASSPIGRRAPIAAVRRGAKEARSTKREHERVRDSHEPLSGYAAVDIGFLDANITRCARPVQRSRLFLGHSGLAQAS